MNHQALFPKPSELSKRACVLWDGLGLAHRTSGIFQYGKRLHDALVTKGIYPTLVYPSEVIDTISASILSIPSSVKLKKLSESKLVWPERVADYLFTREKEWGGEKIFHAHSNLNLSRSAAFHKRWKTVLTIHDLIPFLVPGEVSKALVWQMKWQLPRIVAHVHQVVCVSEWTKKVVIDFYPEIKGKVTVIPNGYPAFNQRAHARKRGQDLRLLTVARAEKYKRLDVILDVLKESPEHFRVTLVTNAAGKAWAEEVGRSFCENQRLKVLVDLSQEALVEEYLRHDVYFHPSLYEGFGLPIVEAFSHGLPVVYRGGSATEESGGLFAGFSVPFLATTKDWLDAIDNAARALDESDFLPRLEAAVTERAGWEQPARTLIKVYDNLLNNS